MTRVLYELHFLKCTICPLTLPVTPLLHLSLLPPLTLSWLYLFPIHCPPTKEHKTHWQQKTAWNTLTCIHTRYRTAVEISFGKGWKHCQKKVHDISKKCKMSWHHIDGQDIIQKAQVSHVACKMHKCKCVYELCTFFCYSVERTVHISMAF